MATVADLCAVLGARLHVPQVERWARTLHEEGVLVGLDHPATAQDAAVLLLALLASLDDPGAAWRIGGHVLLAELASIERGSAVDGDPSAPAVPGMVWHDVTAASAPAVSRHAWKAIEKDLQAIAGGRSRFGLDTLTIGPDAASLTVEGAAVDAALQPVRVRVTWRGAALADAPLRRSVAVDGAVLQTLGEAVRAPAHQPQATAVMPSLAVH